MGSEERVLEIAHDLGFDLAGIAPLGRPPAADRFEEWLDAGHHGSMHYLERNRERIVEPARIRPTARSLVVVGLGHSRPAFAMEGGGRIARYAAGRDYHNTIGRMLKKLGRRLAAEGLCEGGRSIVDAGPLLERSHAAVAGLGFESKAANLLHPDFGPWFFLAEVLVDVDLEPTAGPHPGSCGTCRACLDACPTGAIVEPGVVHAPDCISYQTIENRGTIPRALRPQLGDWAFGCDVCSEVCPFGAGAPDLSMRFGTHDVLAQGGLVRLLELGEAFDDALAGSPLRRPRREGLARNAAIALGNVPGEAGERALLRALSFDPSPIVREAAAWALARGHGGSAGTRDALGRALEREGDPATRREMERSCDELSP